MRPILFVPLLAATLVGCASSPEPAKTAAAPAAAAGPACFKDTRQITGSRLVQRSTDRNVRIIGADEARTDMQDVRSIGNAVGSRGN